MSLTPNYGWVYQTEFRDPHYDEIQAFAYAVDAKVWEIEHLPIGDAVWGVPSGNLPSGYNWTTDIQGMVTGLTSASIYVGHAMSLSTEGAVTALFLSAGVNHYSTAEWATLVCQANVLHGALSWGFDLGSEIPANGTVVGGYTSADGALARTIGGRLWVNRGVTAAADPSDWGLIIQNLGSIVAMGPAISITGFDRGIEINSDWGYGDPSSMIMFRPSADNANLMRWVRTSSADVVVQGKGTGANQTLLIKSNAPSVWPSANLELWGDQTFYHSTPDVSHQIGYGPALYFFSDNEQPGSPPTVGAYTLYSYIHAVIIDNTAGSEDGGFFFYTMLNGTSVLPLQVIGGGINVNGVLALSLTSGGYQSIICPPPSGQTYPITYTLPNTLGSGGLLQITNAGAISVTLAPSGLTSISAGSGTLGSLNLGGQDVGEDTIVVGGVTYHVLTVPL